ncbi:protein TIC 62, chloroplastic isoform X1 [Cynara cardunculus var. scolymus]|uniref:protein TIC 62, chloroplastic isoform X1 n=1 Tax=Cynara cardunculus var. scolymus TaxID=59895 RepID=UPI000D622E93|nr:protein TIC 62, chloroplastic isoform X1 [Cynara cardunculus var. scolymus]
MELRSIQSPVVSSLATQGFIEKQQLICYRQLIRSFGTKGILHSNSIKLRPVRFKAQASSAAKTGSQPADMISKNGENDGNLIFVAGATGKVGSRTVRELLKLGFNVRAGVRSTQRAETLVKSVQQMKLDEALSDGSQPIEKLELVECDLEKPEQIKPALGRASTVICCIGASEKEIFDVTGPYRIDFQATKNLIDAATASKAKQFILVTSLGTNKFGFPAAVLNLFWGVLCWKRKAEEALLASGIPYTIVRPGGMERPTDSFKETHNLTLYTEDTLFGGLVSNLQVAELLAFMAKNPALSYCKVVEVIAETTAPLTPMGDLLAKIPPQRAVTYPPKEPEASKEPEPVPKGSSSESSSIVTETQSQSKPVSARPLSPYTAYEGLKPPVSPIPTAPGGSKVVVEAVSTSVVSETTTTSETIAITAEPAPVAVGLQTTRPLSPYAAYENLKPPTSPTPTPSGSKETPSYSSSTPEIASESTTSVDKIVEIEDGGDAKEDPPQTLTSSNSPYYVYDNLKPPTSPSPSSPSVSPPSTIPVDNGSPSASTPENTSASTVVKPRPLSPYPMYETLKPPSSPIPSTPQ